MPLALARSLPAAVFAACCALAGCQQGKPAVENGQTGSPGGEGGGVSGSPAEQTCEDLDCIREHTGTLDNELGPLSERFPVVAAECAEDLTVTEGMLLARGPLCVCTTEDDREYYVSAEPTGCAVRGHTHECLMEHGEIEPCKESEPEACESVCDEVDARLEADAMTSKPFTVRWADCEEYFTGEYVAATCTDAVVELDGFCYPVRDSAIAWDSWQSCALDDEQVSNASARALPDCADIPDSAPRTADCRRSCEDDADAGPAQGCEPAAE